VLLTVFGWDRFCSGLLESAGYSLRTVSASWRIPRHRDGRRAGGNSFGTVVPSVRSTWNASESDDLVAQGRGTVVEVDQTDGVVIGADHDDPALLAEMREHRTGDPTFEEHWNGDPDCSGVDPQPREIPVLHHKNDEQKGTQAGRQGLEDVYRLFGRRMFARV
jgi:hypothetical protein